MAKKPVKHDPLDDLAAGIEDEPVMVKVVEAPPPPGRFDVEVEKLVFPPRDEEPEVPPPAPPPLEDQPVITDSLRARIKAEQEAGAAALAKLRRA